MVLTAVSLILLGVAVFPFIYYGLVLFGRDLRQRARVQDGRKPLFHPAPQHPRPVRGLDPEAAENFASYCSLDYPQYEVVFCFGDKTTPHSR